MEEVTFVETPLANKKPCLAGAHKSSYQHVLPVRKTEKDLKHNCLEMDTGYLYKFL